MKHINSTGRITLIKAKFPLLLLLGLQLTHCSTAEEYIENEIRQQAAAPGRVPGDETAPPIEETIKLNSIQPNRGETLGGTLIELIGLGFEECMEILVGPNQLQCNHVEYLSATNLRCITPPYNAPERVTVRITRPPTCGPPETTILEQGFEYFDEVLAGNITPVRGPSAGGTLVVINGQGFISGTTVQFGAQAPVEATLIDSTTITAMTPALPRNVYSITLTNMNGTATLPSAFTTFDPIRIQSVTPFAGPLEGGTEVRVEGTGFVNPTSLRFGTQLLTATSNFDETRLNTQTVPASPSLEGPVNVSAQNENGEHLLRNGFIYYDAEDTTPRVIASTPNVGLIAGGSTVNLVVAFLPGIPMEIRFGSEVAQCSFINTFMMECLLPPGEEGVVTVEVDVGGDTYSLVEGFTYLDLRLEASSPNQGSVAGGTYLEVSGNGFEEDTTFSFGSQSARDVTIVNNQTATLRTPPGSAGGVNVSVETLGLEVTADDFFAYFDPSNMNEWTSGDAIDGAVNVTVFESGTGARIEGAFVMAGNTVNPALPHLHGFTDSHGQITLSGPNVTGPLTVHAGKANMGNFSWIDTNSENLTMMMSAPEAPPPDPLPPCPEPSGLLPPLFRGNVVRIKDQFNTGNDTVIVTTTYADFSQQLPDPGPKSQLTSSGEYELVSRTGDLVLMALAGTRTSDGGLNVHAMGFHPYLYAEPSSGEPCDTNADCSDGEQCTSAGEANLCIRVYEDVDIVIDTPVNQPMRVELDNPPLGGPFDTNLPSSVSSNIWYDFGYMGLHMMDSIRLDGDAANQTFYVDMPKRLPGSLANTPFNITAGVFSNVLDNLYPPQSESRLAGLTDTTQTILLSPYLKTHKTVSPIGSSGNPMFFHVNLLPDTLPQVLPTTNAHWLFDFETFIPCDGAMAMQRAVIHWMAFSSPTNTQFFLPVFPETAGNANMPLGATYYWQLMSLYTPNQQFERMNINTVFGWKSRALQVTPFSFP